MAVRKRLTKVKPKKPKTVSAIDRFGDIMAAGYGKEADARTYFVEFYKDQIARLQSIVAKAEASRSWKSMDGCYKQATELYVLASVLYEKFPEHVIMTDGAYDSLCRWVLKNFDKLPEDFCNWYNITCIDLKAGTGHKVVANAAIKWMVYTITGKDMDDGSDAQVRTAKLRRPVKRRIKSAPTRAGTKTGKTLRRLRKKPGD